jgi:2-methylcitrate dehydratase PrpD
MTVTTGIARFVRQLDIGAVPPEVAEKTRTCLLNGYGIGLGCHDTPYVPVARSAALNLYGEHPAGATLLGDGRKTAIAGAVLANAALFHGRAQEDTCGAAHLGTVLIPMLTGLIETRGYSLGRLLPALLAGYEAGGLLEKAYAGRTTPGGFRASPVYGTIAAAAAAAKLADLPEPGIAAALANAASFAGGILQSFADGTDEWRYQVGVAAQAGLTAAELAAAGSVSAPHAIEGRSGFVRAFAKEDCDAGALLAGLGRDWAVLRVTFKPYPVCAFNQTPVTAALALREKLGAGKIASVRVHMNPYETGYAGMDAVGPFDSISGTLMSIPFCIATTLLHGMPNMTRMTTYDDRDVNALIPRIELISDASVPTLCCRVEIATADGRTLMQDQRMTTRDFAFDRKGVSALVRRIGTEQGVPAQAYDILESFVDGLPGGSIHEVLRAFKLLPAARKAARAA